MSNSLNQVQLIGNVTADPEIKQTPNGQFVANFNLATNRTWKDASGQKQDATEFHSVVIWGKLAEIVQSYVQKGKKLFVSGRLQTRTWEDQNGTKRYKTEIVADNLILLSGKSGGSNASDAEEVFGDDEDVAPARTSKKYAPKKDEELNIEDIPF